MGKSPRCPSHRRLTSTVEEVMGSRRDGEVALCNATEPATRGDGSQRGVGLHATSICAAWPCALPCVSRRVSV